MNETVEHTPGPWRVLEWADEKKGFIAIVGPGEPAQHICDVFPFGKRAEGQSLAEHTANARLIAAAPEKSAACDQLHDALRGLLDWVEEGCPEGGRYATVEAKAALKNIQVLRS